MISELQQLSDKVAQLAALTSSLRQENAELRSQIHLLDVEKSELATRIDAAHARVSTLLSMMPSIEPPPELSVDSNSEETA
ncbi:DUF904 domain-containing protein [Herbaspirillum sp. RTI4]|uniref:DUF904 domain-containing protein n=1 Tax=Herbaspirillum sp. RTI4 TaxID=3048640 RepID=UPI002AB56FC4|nr:DUF904 domain-containing protein [Herbaspirillum sp. RTI4]MDY7579993.1 DUF904 domain-containing protein [Herbaspirillum sp. RTI4]MEA9982807.1 DUF904 domain-containing protein [Herbaspirillum sp. RTI4]